MSLLGLLTGCSKNFVSTEYGFRPVSVDTSVGPLRIKANGVSKKTGRREWVTKGPWQLSILLRSDSSTATEECAVRIDNLSLFDGASGGVAAQWDSREKKFSKLIPEDEFLAVGMVFSAQGFEYRDYRLSFDLSFSSQCPLSPGKQEFEVAFDMQTTVGRASLWDNLMGI